MGHAAQAIVDRVKALAPDQLDDRYHELVDKRLLGPLDYTELFELERIEARLDAEDDGERDGADQADGECLPGGLALDRLPAGEESRERRRAVVAQEREQIRRFHGSSGREVKELS